MSDRIYSHRDLIVYERSFAAGKQIIELSKSFPREEMYSLTDQVRRSSRSVSANKAEAWRKRRYITDDAPEIDQSALLSLSPFLRVSLSEDRVSPSQEPEASHA